MATVVAVSTDARPGDVLYDLKRGTEETKLALAGDARGETLLDLASIRLEEVRSLVEGGATALSATGAAESAGTVLAAGADPALVVETLGTMDAQTAEGAALLTARAVATEDAGPLTLLAEWTADQSDGLAALQDDVPRGGRGRGRRLPRPAVGHRRPRKRPGHLPGLRGRPGRGGGRRAGSPPGAVPARRVRLHRAG